MANERVEYMHAQLEVLRSIIWRKVIFAFGGCSLCVRFCMYPDQFAHGLFSANFILTLCKVISVFIEFGRIYVDMKKNMWIWKNKNEQENMKRKTTCGYEKTTLVLKKLNLLYGYIEMILLLQYCYYINVVLWIICPIALF